MIAITELVFLIDRSFSMKRLASDVIGEFNSVIKRQQDEIDGKAIVSTILFDRESHILHNQVLLSEIEPLTEKDYNAIGNFACSFAAAPLDFDNLFNDNAWHESIDKDFFDRLKK